MALLKKLLHRYINRKSVRYGVYALLFLNFFTLLHIWRNSYNVSSADMLTGSYVFPYSGANLLGKKYILSWNHAEPMLKKQIFPHLQCPVDNCVFTEDKDLLDGDYTQFDAILFSDQFLKQGTVQIPAPERRSKSQIYIYNTLESSYNIPACDVNKDDFFNWTFTYRLDSDVLWPYFFVRNLSQHIVAPSIHVQWQEYDNRPIPSVIQNVLSNRTKAAAWLVSNCNSDSSRNDYLTRLKEHLYHFSLKLDVFGGCTKIKCTNDDCATMFRKNYYFYMAFENSFSEDYVTEKVLHGYNNYVVPIVYGGANYSRFLPPGSYLNAYKLHPYNLAYIMHQIIEDHVKYQEFFKWTNYYTIRKTHDERVVHPLCDLCEALNTNRIRRHRRYKNFRLWWNRPNGFKWCLTKEYLNATSLLQIQSSHIYDMY